MMLRNRVSSVLQKTFDESYMACSKAVYYESQGDEDEAMRCWKSALDQIRAYHASKALPSYTTLSGTDKTLIDSLRQLELQCSERIDLLEALRISRIDESSTQRDGGSSSRKLVKSLDSMMSEQREKGFIGQGTIPALSYPDLARPTLPQRPSVMSRTSSERAVVGGSRRPSLEARDASLDAGSSSRTLPTLTPPEHENSRTSSPERYTMRTTLRSGKLAKAKKSTSRPASKTNDPPGASKAATLAWGAIGLRDRAGRSREQEAPAPAFQTAARPSFDQLRRTSGSPHTQFDFHSRRLVPPREYDNGGSVADSSGLSRRSDESFQRPSTLSVSAASSALQAYSPVDPGGGADYGLTKTPSAARNRTAPPPSSTSRPSKTNCGHDGGLDDDAAERRRSSAELPVRRKPVSQTAESSSPAMSGRRVGSLRSRPPKDRAGSGSSEEQPRSSLKRAKGKEKEDPLAADSEAQSSDLSTEDENQKAATAWKRRKAQILKNIPSGVDSAAAKQILNEIVVRGDEVHWGDVAGLEVAKSALREAVVYPFLRPDLFMGLREPARGMLLFGPPGTGKTMLARAVATESKSTFFSISASSLTSKYLGESEKLVRALFGLAKMLAPSIIFVDEIDSLLSQRAGSGEHEATRRIKTEFLIQWSDLQRAAAGRDDKDKERGDANRVLVLAATNLPWAIDEAARRRFVRRQYIPLPEAETRVTQLNNLLGEQKHTLSDNDIMQLVAFTDGFSGSDITALAKDAAMGPLRSLGEALLHMTMDEIRPIELKDFEASLKTIRPSVSKAGLKEYEDWAKEFGERGG